MSITEFSPGTVENLRSYVYWLRDPRDNKVFYVGKGEGNRVFQHIKCLEKGAEPGEETDKEQRIREIAAIPEEEKDRRGYEQVKNLFVQQETQIRDENNHRWAQCEICGEIKRDYRFWTCGGSGRVNLGKCKDCS